MKNNKGFTLTEVLVSIIILGILFGCIIGIVVTSNNLERNIKQKTNTVDKIKEIYDMFSINPNDFVDEVNSCIYANNHVLLINTDGDTKYYKIFFDYQFTESSVEETAWYYILSYKKDIINGLYTLTIETYYNNEKVILVNGIDTYTRTIKVI